ncbi:MAG: SAM-dependent methyltransferase [Acidimicrobiaceae bacterium]|nr:SAM-dependent methyltransferase [Acidimicrobiia bacterium]MCY4494832.1 SAM-dependent methyltransferase [Acidimicrobiaceae bacterium]
MPVSEYVDAALYDEREGFYQAGGRAGRGGDFLTAPEVGPLFGAVISRAIDAWWRDFGCPQQFCVFEWGAGPGTLARTVIAAEPEALRSGALRWHAIERSAAQRAQHLEHPSLVSSATGPGDPARVGVVLANELLDNLGFDLYEHRGQQWFELRVTEGTGPDEFATVSVPVAELSPAVEELTALVGVPVPEGVLVARQLAARDWLAQALASLRTGRVVVFDYGATTAELAARGGWLRTHVGHSGGDTNRWLRDPGTCDITVDVATDQLELVRKADSNRSQADFLRAHGIDDLVAEGKRQWQESAHIGDLSALRARSRVLETEALLDPSGLGAFRAMEWLI